MKRFIRIMAKDINEIIQRLEKLDTVPAETLVLITEHTFSGFMAMASNPHEITEDPITHHKYPVAVTEFSLFTIYTMQTVPVTLLDKTHWTAIQLFKPAQSPSKVFSATRAENLVLIELNDKISQVVVLDMND